MKDAVTEKPAFPGASTGETGPRFLLLLGIRAASTERPSRVSYPIAAVLPYEDERADFEQHRWPENEDDTWTEAKNQRRCDLIDRKYKRSLSPEETLELAWLQQEMLRHRQLVAPLPLADTRRLHQELLARVGICQ